MAQGTPRECFSHRPAPVFPNPPWSGHGGCSSPQVGCQPRPFAGLGKSDRALRHSLLPTQENGHSSVHVRTSRGIPAFLGSTGAGVRKKPLQLGGLEWGGLAFHCWKHRLAGVGLPGSGTGGDQLRTVLGGLPHCGYYRADSRLLHFHT